MRSLWLPLLAVSLLALALPRTALAQPPDPALVARLSQHAKSFGELSRRASFRLERLVEELDGDGKVSESKVAVARVESDGKTQHEIVESCLKNGKDATAEEREKVKKEEEEEAKKKKSGDDDDLDLPFSASNAYDYDQVGVDAADPTRVEIAFTPKKPGKHTVEGKVWADTTSGTILSAGVKLSKPPTFVDWVHFTVEFGAKTPLGPAISRLTFEAKAGILFIRKHLRGEVKMSDYRLAP